MYIYINIFLIYFCYMGLLFKVYLKRWGLVEKQQSHKRTFVSKDVGDEIQQFACCHVLAKFVCGNRFGVAATILGRAPSDRGIAAWPKKQNQNHHANGGQQGRGSLGPLVQSCVRREVAIFTFFDESVGSPPQHCMRGVGG